MTSDKMGDSKQEKYLGDQINSTGNINSTIEERKNKGYAIVAEIIAILDEIPLGRYRMEIGLKLRQAMLLNGVLFNSEAWHSVDDKAIRKLEVVDEHLLRSLVQGHSKLPLEFLYLEAGAIPIRFMLSSRRLMYLQMILKREDDELVKRIFTAQKSNPCPGDFTELIKKDFEVIKEDYNERKVQNMSKNEYKKHVKSRIKSAALDYLKEIQGTHSKIKHIKYDELKAQEYMMSPLFSNDEVNLLHCIRARYLDCKANFSQRYLNDNLLCALCKSDIDDQKHILVCDVLQKEMKAKDVASARVEYDDIFAKDVKKQKTATALFTDLLRIRKDLLMKQDPSSSSQVELRGSNNLQPCIVYSSFGK